MANFLLNAWYMAGWSNEIENGRTMSRMIAGQHLALYRTETGVLVALADRCPHRFAPLSAGKVQGETLACPYHGLRFDGVGQCVHNPQGAAPSAVRVRSYPVRERTGMVWLWPGDPERADDGLIPVLPGRGDPARRSLDGYSYVKADYRLAVDNLLDLTHISFLHPAFGGEDFKPDNTVVQEGETVSSSYEALDWPSPEYSEVFFPDLSGHIDEIDTMRWQAPSTCFLEIKIAPVGELETASRSNHDAHMLTPETETTAHYFWTTSFGKETSASDETLRTMLTQAFDVEDKPMLEMQQATMGEEDFWALKPLLLKGDNAAVRARRILDAKIKAEQSLVPIK